MIRYSSSLGRAVFHIGFKAKYCYKVFSFEQVRNRCKEIFLSVAEKYKITIYKIGFDDDHVHLEADIGIKSIPEVAKLFKGTSGYMLLKEFPWLKRKFFWGSGLWSPVVFFDSVGQNHELISVYISSQKYH